jgi:Ribosomal proteins 50S-L18Ae/60S-L20/60S-L18A
MYKEFRELTRADAVRSLYQDMAARHRARFRSIHVRAIWWRSVYLHSRHDRFSASWRLRRQRMFVDRISSNFWSRNSASHSPIVLARLARHSSHIARLRSERHVVVNKRCLSPSCHRASVVVVCMQYTSWNMLSNLYLVMMRSGSSTRAVHAVGCFQSLRATRQASLVSRSN